MVNAGGDGHGAASRSPQSAPQFDCRIAFSRTLLELAAANDRVCAVVNDSVSSAKLNEFKTRFPERLVNVGIAEQNMLGLSAGLANAGMIPFVCGASCFLTARAMEQLKVDLAYSRSNVKLCGMSSGMAYGALGPTHHSIEDIAWTRVLPNLHVIVPAGPNETAAAIRFAAEYEGPVFVRISRIPVPEVTAAEAFVPGRAQVLRQGRDVTLAVNGVMVARALMAADALAAQGVEARVLNLSSVKPLDEEAMLAAARETRGIVTAEEGFRKGGLGGAVAELLATRQPAPMRILGVPDTFAPTGRAEFLLEHFALTAQGIAEAALEIVRGRPGAF